MANIVQMEQTGIDPGLNNQFEVFTVSARVPRGMACSGVTIPSEGKISIVEYRPGNRTVPTKRPGAIEYPNIEIEVAFGCGYELQVWARDCRKFVLEATAGPTALRGPRQTQPPASFREIIKIVASDSGRPLKEYTLYEAWVCDTKPKNLQGTNNPEPWMATYEVCFERMDVVDLYVPNVIQQPSSSLA
jgi:hypothetical protein